MPSLPSLLDPGQEALRVAVIALVAVGAVLLVRLVRKIGQRVSEARLSASFSKVRTLGTLFESMAVFAIGFVAVGLILRELGISLAAYLASASVLGLAIGFGSQGLVQDVVTGLTLVLSNTLDVGDMVEISGQTGVVGKIGIRFTSITNFVGAEVLIPNRNIANVTVYPRGYVRAFLDVELPADSAAGGPAEQSVRGCAEAAYEQFPATLLGPPALQGRIKTRGGAQFLRLELHLWPGQGALIESVLRPRIVQALRRFDPDYTEWRVAVTYRAEGGGTTPQSASP